MRIVAITCSDLSYDAAYEKIRFLWKLSQPSLAGSHQLHLYHKFIMSATVQTTANSRLRETINTAYR